MSQSRLPSPRASRATVQALPSRSLSFENPSRVSAFRGPSRPGLGVCGIWWSLQNAPGVICSAPEACPLPARFQRQMVGRVPALAFAAAARALLSRLPSFESLRALRHPCLKPPDHVILRSFHRPLAGTLSRTCARIWRGCRGRRRSLIQGRGEVHRGCGLLEFGDHSIGEDLGSRARPLVLADHRDISLIREGLGHDRTEQQRRKGCGATSWG